MIVCSCNLIRDREIRDIARQGVTDIEQIYATLGHRPNCFQCHGFALEIVEEEHRQAA